MAIDFRSHLQAVLGDAYTVEREIGGGGMSRVFVAEDTTLRRRIVVKMLPAEIAAEVSLARFQREIALAASLQHPHIVPLLISGDADGLPYYTMPLVEGETLRQRLDAGALPISETVRLLREIATALAYAHDKGIVHRDIKPENVLLSRGIALVTDFGVAKALLVASPGAAGDLTAAGVAIGTPAYMSPEQVSADPSVDHRADLYAFGMLAYEMLAGRSPFAGRTAAALLAAHVLETPEPLEKARPDVPFSLAALVARCLEKDPAHRPRDAHEIVRALDALATPGGTPALSARVWRRAKRGGVAAGAMLLVAAGAWFVAARGAREVPAGSKVLVAPFENLTGDPALDHVGRLAADAVAMFVLQDGSVDVVPSNVVLAAFRDTTGGIAKSLKQLTDATRPSMLVTGSFARRGDSLTLRAQVTDVRTGNVVETLDPTASAASDPIAAINALADRLVGALGMRAFHVLSQRGFRAPTTAALQEFAKGFELFAVKGDNAGARPFFERAIALDSTFVRAYQLLGRQYLNSGQFARADSIAKRIERLPQRLTANEQAQLEFMKLQLSGDLAGALRLQQRLAARDSNALSLHLIGVLGMALLRPDLVIPAVEATLPTYALIGGVAERDNVVLLLDAYHRAGMHDRELRALSAYRATQKDVAYWGRIQLRAYAGAGDAVAALALVDSLRGASNDSLGVVIESVAAAAIEFKVHGDSATASRLYATGREWIATHPAGAQTIDRRIREATLFLGAGLSDSAFNRLRSVQPRGARLFAVATALRGDTAAARGIADSLRAVDRPWTFGSQTYARAAIAGALGDRAHAVQLLTQASREGARIDAWRYDVTLLSLHGYPAFEDLVRPKR
jgi:tRNA A-37 threonylcarbamoyl transferase component Bud32/TolB-like protein